MKEMGCRRMLTRELLEEMQHDCNENIRVYAEKKIIPHDGDLNYFFKSIKKIIRFRQGF